MHTRFALGVFKGSLPGIIGNCGSETQEQSAENWGMFEAGDINLLHQFNSVLVNISKSFTEIINVSAARFDN